MTASYNVILTGEVQPGHAREAALQALAGLMKLPADRVARLLSGRETVVRRAVPQAQVASYLAALRRAGAAARVQAVPADGAGAIPLPVLHEVASEAAGNGLATELTAAPMARRAGADAAGGSDVAGHAARPPAGEQECAQAQEARQVRRPDAGPAQAPVAAEPSAGPARVSDGAMQCPACGAQQPRRTLCRACGADMPRVSAARAEAADAAKRPVPSEVRTARGRAPSRAFEHGATCHETPHPLSLSLHGRLGRLRYLAYAFPAYIPVLIGAALGALIGGVGRPTPGFVIPLALGALVTAWLGVRAMVLRLHDLDRSGKWVLAAMVPPAVAALGQSAMAAAATGVMLIVASVLLVLLPGSRGTNAYGAPPGPNTAWTIAGAVLALALAAASGAADPGGAWVDAGPAADWYRRS